MDKEAVVCIEGEIALVETLYGRYIRHLPAQTIGGGGKAPVEDGDLVAVLAVAGVVNDMSLGAIGLRSGCPVEAVGTFEQGLVDAADIEPVALAVPQRGAARLDGLGGIDAADDGAFFVGLMQGFAEIVGALDADIVEEELALSQGDGEVAHPTSSTMAPAIPRWSSG